jgi:hypothetical protein
MEGHLAIGGEVAPRAIRASAAAALKEARSHLVIRDPLPETLIRSIASGKRDVREQPAGGKVVL